MLHISDGQLVQLEKVRTRSAAVRRLIELAVESAAGQPVDLAVQYLGDAGRAAELAGRLAELIPGAREIYQVRADAVIGVHAGQGMLGVVVAPDPARTAANRPLTARTSGISPRAAGHRPAWRRRHLRFHGKLRACSQLTRPGRAGPARRRCHR